MLLSEIFPNFKLILSDIYEAKYAYMHTCLLKRGIFEIPFQSNEESIKTFISRFILVSPFEKILE